MLEGILQGLCEWIYGLFLDLIAYCANALLGVMTTDLTFWETSVPVVTTLYKIFVAVGWGLLIGNCAFQAMKAMFAGFGFETESRRYWYSVRPCSAPCSSFPRTSATLASLSEKR